LKLASPICPDIEECKGRVFGCATSCLPSYAVACTNEQGAGKPESYKIGGGNCERSPKLAGAAIGLRRRQRPGCWSWRVTALRDPASAGKSDRAKDRDRISPTHCCDSNPIDYPPAILVPVSPAFPLNGARRGCSGRLALQSLHPPLPHTIRKLRCRDSKV
jgi:hypothetical protein